MALSARPAPRKPRSPAGRARLAARMLAEVYPEAICELNHSSPYELLVATILSAQCTDARVNLVTPALFERWCDASALALAEQGALEAVVRSTGFYASKARNLLAMAGRLVDHFDGEVPTSLEDLVSLAGVGRKTANVIRTVAFDLPGFPVDTHVLRLTSRLGITDESDPVKVEMIVNPMIPASERGDLSLRLILHGRRICAARRPACDHCTLSWWCPSAHQF